MDLDWLLTIIILDVALSTFGAWIVSKKGYNFWKRFFFDLLVYASFSPLAAIVMLPAAIGKDPPAEKVTAMGFVPNPAARFDRRRFR